jgi:hypothetical protein
MSLDLPQAANREIVNIGFHAHVAIGVVTPLVVTAFTRPHKSVPADTLGRNVLTG